MLGFPPQMPFPLSSIFLSKTGMKNKWVETDALLLAIAARTYIQPHLQRTYPPKGHGLSYTFGYIFIRGMRDKLYGNLAHSWEHIL